MQKGVIFLVCAIIFICLTFTPSFAKSKKILLNYDFDNCKKIAKQPSCECSKGGIRCIDGVKNRAMAFLGKGDFIKESSVPKGSFSVSFWMRTVERGANRQGGNFFGCTGLVDAKVWGVALCDDKIGFGLEKTTITSKTKGTTGRWLFVVATMDADLGELKLYVNGELEAEANVIFQYQDLSSAPYLYIGASQSIEGAYFYGSLDELKVYNEVLKADEIKKIYNKLNPYNVRTVQITTTKVDYKEIEYEREVEVERRPRPTPR